MELSQLLDALSISFFALLGLWAGAARGHWFLRGAAVSSFLLIALLLPAYEVVIEFGLQMAIISLVVSVVQGRAPWRARWSLETVLLLTVVLAVVFAIIGNLPDFTATLWLRLVGIGVITALFALLCMWIVFGRSRLRWRLVGGEMAVVLLLVALHFGDALQYAISNAGSRQGWWSILLRYYDVDYIGTWLLWNFKTVAVGMAVMLFALVLARATGWFAGAGPDAMAQRAAKLPTGIRVARVGLCLTVAGVGLPLLYVLYCLLTPPPFPALSVPSPNGFDDFVAAGQLMPEGLPDAYVRRTGGLTLAQLEHYYSRVAPLLPGIESGLGKECRIADPFWNKTNENEFDPLFNCSIALIIRSEYLQKSGATDRFVPAVLQELRFSEESTRGVGLDSWSLLTELTATSRLQSALGSLHSQACREIAIEVARFDRNREPYEERQAIQSIIDQHSDWQTRLNHLLTVWSGAEPRPMNVFQQQQVAQTRLLSIDAALQAYTLEHGRPPQEVTELVPEYLDEIPLDVFSTGPIRYLRDGSRYKVYSVGSDRDDDHGAPETQFGYGDIVCEGPHLHPLLTQLGEAASAAWQKVQSLVPTTREGEAPAEP